MDQLWKKEREMKGKQIKISVKEDRSKKWMEETDERTNKRNG